MLLNNQKKGYVYGLMLVIISSIVLGTAFSALHQKQSGLGGDEKIKRLGDKQNALFTIYGQGEKALMYLDFASRFIVEETTLDLALKGGYHNAKCGVVGGEQKQYEKNIEGTIDLVKDTVKGIDTNQYSIWATPSKECFPDTATIEEEFGKELSFKLKEYTTLFPGPGTLPSKYKVWFKENSIVAVSTDQIQLTSTFNIRTTQKRITGTITSEGKTWLLPEVPDLEIPVPNDPKHAGRHFKAFRSNGARFHAGVDLLAPENSKVVATEAGTVVNKYPFYDGTYSLLVETDSGYVINYGEIAPNTPVNVGDRVQAGQHIANVQCHGSGCMVHFELYTKGTRSNSEWKPGRKPENLLDPVPYLKALRNEKTEEEKQENEITGNVVAVQGEKFRVTHYNTAHEKDFSKWYGGYSTSGDGMYYCRIPINQRGFYEDVKCEGSGITKEGKICRYFNIKTVKETSNCVEPGGTVGSRGITALGVNPTPKRTIAVDPDLIPLESTVLIDFGPGFEEWNGCYVAEDVGGGIQNKHIDLYVGIGKEVLQETAHLPNYATVKVTKCNPKTKYTSGFVNTGEKGESQLRIKYTIPASFEQKLKFDMSAFYERYVDEAKKTTDEFKECIQKKSQKECVGDFNIMAVDGVGTFLTFEKKEVFPHNENKEITLRYAIALQDVTPPEPVTVPKKEVEKISEEKKIKVELKWEKRTERDIAHYNVYCFMEDIPENIEQGEAIKQVPKEKNKTSIESCNKEPFKAGEKYTFIITAVDTNGNENTFKKEIQTIEWNPVCCKSVEADRYVIADGKCRTETQVQVSAEQCTADRVLATYIKQ